MGLVGLVQNQFDSNPASSSNGAITQWNGHYDYATRQGMSRQDDHEMNGQAAGGAEGAGQ